MNLNLTSLVKAIASLTEAIESTEDVKFMSSLSDAQQRTMRAGVIQSFEFSYELSWKMLSRQLKSDDGEATISVLSRKDLYRFAAKKGLLDEPEAWFVFHKARNETSHTYDEKKANEVYRVALDFLPHAKALLAKLEARQS
ncbi:MAG: nucleotidyltransferase substrate binding protein (TIGR01987 family) [Lentisphaeria bacterium]|jgi:nucleotidyltransferase substrate binding protein (TIGR01987 family)